MRPLISLRSRCRHQTRESYLARDFVKFGKGGGEGVAQGIINRPRLGVCLLRAVEMDAEAVVFLGDEGAGHCAGLILTNRNKNNLALVRAIFVFFCTVWYSME